MCHKVSFPGSGDGSKLFVGYLHKVVQGSDVAKGPIFDHKITMTSEYARKTCLLNLQPPEVFEYRDKQYIGDSEHSVSVPDVQNAKINSTGQLKQRIGAAAAEIAPAMLQKVFRSVVERWSLCLDLQGGHIEMH
ncbi:hypothetical protein C0J52_14319 [Blattella germanica]|nr:hypothetical protein C0J52_14319 [Blattella germanica]